MTQPESQGGARREPPEAEWVADLLPTLVRRARAAQQTYVGRHWPSVKDMRRDGVGYGLVEDRANEAKIHRYLDTFQPEFMVDLLAEFQRLRGAALRSARAPGWEVAALTNALTVEMLILDDEDPGAFSLIAIDDSAARHLAHRLAPRLAARLAAAYRAGPRDTEPSE